MQDLVQVFNSHGCDKLAIDTQVSLKAYFPGDDKPDIVSLKEDLKYAGWEIEGSGELINVDDGKSATPAWNLLSTLNMNYTANRSCSYRCIQLGVIVGVPSAVCISYFASKRYGDIAQNDKISLLYSVSSGIIGAVGGYIWSVNDEENKIIEEPGFVMITNVLFGAMGGFCISEMMKFLDKSYQASDDQDRS